MSARSGGSGTPHTNPSGFVPEAASAEYRQRVLRERAERIARRSDDSSVADRLEVLVFQLLSESYAIETCYIREVIPLRNLAEIPCTPAFYLGVINVRGELCPVIDLRLLFSLQTRGITNASRVVLLRKGDTEVGILADSIVGAASVDRDRLRPLAGVASSIHEDFLRGCMPDNVIVIDAGRILAHPRLVVNEQVDA